jgi:hypothetical protein
MQMAATTRFVKTEVGWFNLDFASTITTDPNNANRSIVTDDNGNPHSVPATAYHPGRADSTAPATRRFIEVKNNTGPGTYYFVVRHIREIREESNGRLVAIDDQSKRHTVASGESFGGTLSSLVARP